ncbi:MAG: DUF1232 domain-containing protein [Gammaproteobacteria bacterium]|nr:DUF1232 domain-containing protein [Gammaproteobacteria bacterium]
MKSLIVAILGLLSILYIINPTAGIFELIPDNLPFVGNLDELAASTLLLSCLSYFGIDLFNIFKKDKSNTVIDNEEITKQ